MPKTKKIILGIFTIWPLLYTATFLLFVFPKYFLPFILTGMNRYVTPANALPDSAFLIIIILHTLTIILSLILLFIYISNIFKNSRIPQEKKFLWTLILFFGNMITMPIYWYLYIWKDQNQIS